VRFSMARISAPIRLARNLQSVHRMAVMSFARSSSRGSGARMEPLWNVWKSHPPCRMMLRQHCCSSGMTMWMFVSIRLPHWKNGLKWISLLESHSLWSRFRRRMTTPSGLMAITNWKMVGSSSMWRWFRSKQKYGPKCKCRH
jgi:hypothetical protein